MIVLIVTLCAGLNPRDYRFRDHPKWNSDGIGIAFEKYAGAHTAPFVDRTLADRFRREGFTLELALNGAGNTQEGFAFVSQFHAGDAQSQLVIAQWREHLIIMNGDDYAHRFSTPRITVDISEPTNVARLLAVISGPGGTRIYLNGERIAEKESLILMIPSAPQSGRVVLGNSVYGTDSWIGRIGGFALFARMLSDAEIEAHHADWRASGTFAFAESLDPRMLFTFEEGRGLIVGDRSSHRTDLLMGLNGDAVDRRFLRRSIRQIRFNRSFVSDTLVNLLGFIPFGICTSWVLAGFGIRATANILIATVAAAALSGSIELAQAWMPSRNSSMLDLILNTLGGFLGATFRPFDRIILGVPGHDLPLRS